MRRSTFRPTRFVPTVWQSDYQMVSGSLTVVPNLGRSFHARVLHGPTSPRTRADYGARIEAVGLAGIGRCISLKVWKNWLCAARVLRRRPVNVACDID